MSKKNYYKPYLTDEAIAKLAACGEYFEHNIGKPPYDKVKPVITHMLLYAINQNNMEAFNILTSESVRQNHETLINPSVNERDVSPPLHAAIEAGRLEMVKALLSFGADPNLKDDRKRTGFSIALNLEKSLKDKMLAELYSHSDLKSGLETIEELPEEFRASLIEIVASSSYITKEMLIEPWIAKDASEREPVEDLLYDIFLQAIHDGNEKVINIIFSDTFKDVISKVLNWHTEEKPETILGYAIDHAENLENPVNFVDRCLKAGASLKLQDYSEVYGKAGYTPLHAAISRGNEELVQIILEHNPDLTIQSKKNDETPLMLAQRKGNDAITKMVEEAVAKQEKGESSEEVVEKEELLREKSESSEEVSDEMIEALKKIQSDSVSFAAKDSIRIWFARNDESRGSLAGLLRSVLACEIAKLNDNVIDFILSDTFQDITPNILNYVEPKKTQTSILVNVIAIVRDSRRDDEQIPVKERREKLREIFIRLIEKGADINRQDYSMFFNGSGYTPLHAAISIGDEKLVQIILGCNPDLTIESKYSNETPLMLAERKQNKAIIRMVEEAQKKKTVAKEEISEATTTSSSNESVEVEEEGNKTWAEINAPGGGFYPMERAVAWVFGRKPGDFIFNYRKPKSDQQKAELIGNLQWTAFGPNKFNTVGAKKDLAEMLSNFTIKHLRENKTVSEGFLALSDESKEKFKTFLCYTSKLYSEIESTNDEAKKEQLESKVNAATEFIKTVLTTSPLTAEAIEDAKTAMERADINRSKLGFYRVSTFFKKKRFLNDSEDHRAVKSTLGELGYDLAESLKGDVKSKLEM